jgi:small-conductance mechanosensitive channel
VAAPNSADASAGQSIVESLNAATTQLLSLDPREAAINSALSLAVVGAALGLVWALDWLLRRGADRLAERGLVRNHRRGAKVAAVTWSLVKLGVGLGATLVVLDIWGLAPLAWLSGRAGATATRIVVLIVAAVGLLEVTGHVLDRLFQGLVSRSADLRRAAQFRTLGPIIKGLVQGLMVIFIGLTVLSEVGVKIGPLLAGAGVVGVALGFGAQTLVKDFLTGLFLIIEDIVSVGDNVKIGGCTGRVETMTLRTIRLRDFDGTLHVFPYSEAQVIHNRTKAFSNAVFELRISYLTDIDRAFEAMRAAGAALQAEKAFGSKILQPLEIVGVDEFSDTGPVLKARFRTLPGAQWEVRREFMRRLKQAFDAARIEMGYPNVQADRAARAAPDGDGAAGTAH